LVGLLHFDYHATGLFLCLSVNAKNAKGATMNRPEFEIKEQIRLAGLQMRDVAAHLEMPYGTLASQLNGFAPLSYENRRKIEILIVSAETKQSQTAA
jgi:hypothetical protein